MWVLFLRVKNYDSIKGAAIAIMFIVALAMKIMAIKPQGLFFAPKTLVVSGLLVMSFTLISVVVILIIKRNKLTKYSLSYIMLMLFLYILFGFGQQLLFQFVFLEVFYFLTKNAIFSILLSSMFYFIFHPKGTFGKFYFATFILGLFWSTIYVFFGNIIWLSISHGIIGCVYFTLMYDKKVDPIRNKIRIAKALPIRAERDS